MEGLENCHDEAPLPAGGRDLGADEAGAHHDDPTRVFERGPEGETVVERAQQVDALERGRAGQGPRARPGRDDEAVECQVLAAVERDLAPTHV